MPPPPVEARALCRAWGYQPLLLSARSIGRDRAGPDARSNWAWIRSESPTATLLAGVVRMHSACKDAGLKPLIGCRLDLHRTVPGDASARLSDRPRRLWPPVAAAQPRQDARGERRMRAQPCRRRGACRTASPSLPGRPTISTSSKPSCRGFAKPLPSLRHVAASWLYRGDDAARIERLDRIARANDCTILATNDVHYHAPDRRPLQDVVTCIREKVTIANAGYLLNPNAERHLKSPARNGAAIRALAPCDRRDARVRGRTELQPRRAALRISQGDSAGRTNAAAVSRASDLGRRCAALARRHSGQGPEATPSRAHADRKARLRPLFPDRPRHRRFRAVTRPADPVPGPRIGGEQRGLLLPRDHRGRPGDQRPFVRALHLRGAARAARHRRRFRA